jgi:hypothetical protein
VLSRNIDKQDSQVGGGSFREMVMSVIALSEKGKIVVKIWNDAPSLNMSLQACGASFLKRGTNERYY